MRSPDFFAMLFAMGAVPLASWIVGKLTGRRNWGVGMMLGLTLLVSGLVQAGLLFDYTLFSQAARPPQRDVWIGGPEFSGFLFALGAFVSLLIWSATPARQAPSSQAS